MTKAAEVELNEMCHEQAVEIGKLRGEIKRLGACQQIAAIMVDVITNYKTALRKGPVASELRVLAEQWSELAAAEGGEMTERELTTQPKEKPQCSNYGWVCPACGCGNAPTVSRCACYEGLRVSNASGTAERAKP